MLRNIDLKNFMVANPAKVRADDNLMEAIHQILVNKISGVCVVDAEDRLVGVLSELDCLRGILSATYNDTGIGTVGEFMTAENLETASPQDHIVGIAADMLSGRKRRLPVVQADGKLVGQITIRQILRAVKEFSSPANHGKRG